MKISLKRNLIIGFGISLLLLIVSSAASLTSIHNLFASAGWVDHTHLVVENLEKTMAQVQNAESGQRGFLITGRADFLEYYGSSQDAARAALHTVAKITTDNPEQQRNVARLETAIDQRFRKMQEMIATKKDAAIIRVDDMEQGRQFMNEVRRSVDRMIEIENGLLKTRTERLNRFSAYTPALIIIAAILAILITSVFYFRTNTDFNEKNRLQEELEARDRSIRERINIIRDVADKISSGNFSTRVTDTGSDELGNISGSLNKMSAALEKSFGQIADRQWIQEGIVKLNRVIVGEDSLQVMAEKVLNFLSAYTGSQAGAFLTAGTGSLLAVQSTYALDSRETAARLGQDGGIAYQVFKSGKRMLLAGDTEKHFDIKFSALTVAPAGIVVFPLLFDHGAVGVIELGSFDQYSSRQLDFFKDVEGIVGIAVNTAFNRQRVAGLLMETRSQAEELMTQQAELEHINTELEMQAQQLQTSEEELKVQSEELIETNTLLEERSASLEQRNQLILQKNAEIEKKAADLALSTRYKSEFLANMSHELRTPLNSILLLSRLMAENHDKNLSPDQVQYATVIQSSGNGLLQLIDEILDLSKIESGKMTIEHLPVNTREFVGELKGLFEPVAREKNLQWEIIIAPGVPETIQTDSQRLSQILKNLLSNAFKFTASGFVKLELTCPADQPGLISFGVRDSGIGISPDKQSLIFDAFQQEDGSTRRRYGGTGLGLSISRELARLLGGEIKLQSQPGEGSDFLCLIQTEPGKMAKAVKEENTGGGTEPAAPVTTETPETPAYNSIEIPEDIPDDRNSLQSGDKLVLIIEDDTNFARALLDYSRQKGYRGIVTVRGDTGIELARKYLPLAILLDIQLPVKNGWEVMDELKNDPHTRHIPVHIMSSQEVRKESIRRGAVDFIIKPVAFEQLNTIFDKLEYVLARRGKKVLIVEENFRHANALAYYLSSSAVAAIISRTVAESITTLQQDAVNCVILDLGSTGSGTDEVLEKIRGTAGLEDVPIILFTGKNLSQPDEFRLKQYADAIVLKTANSYKRILDEVSLFLHLVQEKQPPHGEGKMERLLKQDNVLKGKKVLLADDDIRNIFAMTKILQKYQMTVIPAMDGREALQLLKSSPVDAVLMDMMMPEMDGYESIKAIRQERRYQKLPVIAVTAKTMAGDREKCIAAGASDYISKPVDMDQLVSLLRIWLYEKGY